MTALDAAREDRAVGALLGLAVGDAVGTPLEFTARDSRPALTGMVGGGPFHLAPGEWTDDTSMALCLAESLLARRGLDQRDLMERFVRWYRDGENSVTGNCFDIGNTTRRALERFIDTGVPAAGSTDAHAAGNGSLMRLAPVSILWHGEPQRATDMARAQSATTHAAPAALDACAHFALLLVEAIRGEDREVALRPRIVTGDPAVTRIAAGAWRHKGRDEIASSGYVVHTLEAALWSVARARDFEDAVLTAANLGDDADTVAAVTGQLAGALWGAAAIPRSWLERLAWRDRIEDLARRLYALGAAAAPEGVA